MSPTVVQRFLSEKRGLTLKTADKLAKALDMILITTRPGSTLSLDLVREREEKGKRSIREMNEVASIFKAKGKVGSTPSFTRDEHGHRRKKRRATPTSGSRNGSRKNWKSGHGGSRTAWIDPKAETCTALHEGTSLLDHLVDFERSLVGQGRDRQARPYESASGLAACSNLSQGQANLRPFALEGALTAVQALRDAGLSQQSINHHVRRVKGFSRWLWSDGWAREHHLAHLATSSPDADRRHVRRLLSPEEAAQLVQVAETGPEAGNLSGPDRAMLYAFGPRDRIPRKRTADLDPRAVQPRHRHAQPSPANRAILKNGKEAVQPHRSIASRSAPSLACREGPWKAHVFDGMTKRTAEMIRVDLKAAGIPYETDSRSSRTSIRFAGILFPISSHRARASRPVRPSPGTPPPR